jgi:hypothetical protein
MPRLLRTVGRTAVVAGTATTVSNRVSRRQAGRWSEQSEQQVPAEPAPPQPAAPPAAEDAMDARIGQLKQLGELRDQGLLSEAEFAAQKAKVLGT